jgi:hypothetical protein
MTALVAGPQTSVYSDYWRTAPNVAISNMIDRRSVKVFSGRDADLEAGFEPNLEAVFATVEEANTYVATWSALYDQVDFWVEA